jgi:hypothetical protein
MKKILFSTVLALFVVNMFAQPVSGFLGKKLMTSFELEVVPGTQEYEANQSGFLAFGVLTESATRSYTPRIFLNADYQLWNNMAVSGSIGYSRMRVPLYNSYNHGMNTTIVQLRLKSAMGNGKFPTSSTYYAFGLGLYFGSMNDLPTAIDFMGNPLQGATTSVNASNLAFNFELGRRIVFNGGIVLDFGFATNLSTGLGNILDFNEGNSSFFQEVTPISPEYVKDQMKTRMALNSIFNFKIGIGYFVH